MWTRGLQKTAKDIVAHIHGRFPPCKQKRRDSFLPHFYLVLMRTSLSCILGNIPLTLVIHLEVRKGKVVQRQAT